MRDTVKFDISSALHIPAMHVHSFIMMIVTVVNRLYYKYHHVFSNETMQHST